MFQLLNVRNLTVFLFLIRGVSFCPYKTRFFRHGCDITNFSNQKTRAIGVSKYAAAFTGCGTQLGKHLTFKVFVVYDIVCYLVDDADARVEIFVLLAAVGIHTTQDEFHSSLGWKIVGVGSVVRQQQRQGQCSSHRFHNLATPEMKYCGRFAKCNRA